MNSERHPYPYPTVENDGTLRKDAPIISKTTAPKTTPSHFDRLHNSTTLSSLRHQIYYDDPEAPQDSLDINLKAKYDQHSDTFSSNTRTRLQPETLGDSERKLNGKEKKTKNSLKDNKVTTTIGKMEHINQTKLAISGHHTMMTNRGYSRKPDGGFFVI
ncbi:hypothetical protein SNEBB_011046 [Seison nebaliae]|nr:hypothetical protein SNEBB_011046 [Seison nebaliae]